MCAIGYLTGTNTYKNVPWRYPGAKVSVAKAEELDKQLEEYREHVEARFVHERENAR